MYETEQSRSLLAQTRRLQLNTLQRENIMWWMLLLALEGEIYRAEIVVRSEEQCILLKTSDEDLCVPVEVRFPAPAQGAPAS